MTGPLKLLLASLADARFSIDHTDIDEVIPLFVGPIMGASASANPPAGFLVTALAEFDNLGKRLIAALNDATTDALPITLRTRLSDMIEERSLEYPMLLNSLCCNVLRDL